MSKVYIDLHSKPVWLTLVILSLSLVALPFIMVTYVPSIDLPQHLAQIKLFLLSVSDPVSPYEIHYVGANIMIYWIMLVLWFILPPVLTGKVTMLLLALSWVISIFVLARSEGRSPVSAAIAAMLVFNSSLYWGFVNFLSGFPVMVVWYLLMVRRRQERITVWYAAGAVLLSLLLFFAHAFWLIAAVLMLFAVDIIQKTGLKRMGIHAVLLLPVSIAAAVWFPKLASTRTVLGFDTAPHWFVPPYERLLPQWMVNSLFGGLQGPVEWIIVFGLLVWIGLSVVTNRKGLWEAVNKNFFIVAVIFFVAALVLPDKFMNTISFAVRWFPIAMIFLLLSLPLPRIPSVIPLAFTIMMFIIFSITTTLSWIRFDTNDLSGLSESLEKIPENSRVIGLDFVKKSPYIDGRPFIQTFAYAQALHGGTLNFSFAEHNSGIVVPKQVMPVPKWTPGLEWVAEYVMYEDLQKFDAVLINAPDELHKILLSITPLQPETDDGQWRLYRVMKDERKGFIINF